MSCDVFSSTIKLLYLRFVAGKTMKGTAAMRVERFILETNNHGELPPLHLKPRQRVKIIVLPDDVDELRLVAEKNLDFWDNQDDECWNHV
jgi:hypothetical protein